MYFLADWLGKVWANRLLEKQKQDNAKEIEAIRSQFRKEVDEQLHILRDHIERGQFIHKLQFETEFNAYRDLWQKVVTANSAAFNLRPIADFRPVGKSDKEIKDERLKTLYDAHFDLRKSYIFSRPFLAPVVYNAMTALAEIIHVEGVGYQYGDPRQDRQQYWEESEKNAKQMEMHSNAICEAIRERIGMMSQASTDASPTDDAPADAKITES
jgi:hypothetical protein